MKKCLSLLHRALWSRALPPAVSTTVPPLLTPREDPAMSVSQHPVALGGIRWGGWGQSTDLGQFNV